MKNAADCCAPPCSGNGGAAMKIGAVLRSNAADYGMLAFSGKVVLR